MKSSYHLPPLDLLMKHPNENNNTGVSDQSGEIVYLRDALESEEFESFKNKDLSIVVGKSIPDNKYLMESLYLNPHLLIEGDSGTEATAFLHSIIVSLLYHNTPDDLRFIFIDTSKEKFCVYNNIGKQYFTSVNGCEEGIITSYSYVVDILNSVCKEVGQRYDLFSKNGVRNIFEYNEKVVREKAVEVESEQKLPQLVIVINEIRDLIFEWGADFEIPLCNLLQRGGAVAGINIIIAIKELNSGNGMMRNLLMDRVSFIDSSLSQRELLGEIMTDKYRGDLLPCPGEAIYTTWMSQYRLHACFVDMGEIERVCEWIATNNNDSLPYNLPGVAVNDEERVQIYCKDKLFNKAVQYVKTLRKISIPQLQIEFGISYQRACILMLKLEIVGIVGPEKKRGKPRDVLINHKEALDAKKSDRSKELTKGYFISRWITKIKKVIKNKEKKIC